MTTRSLRIASTLLCALPLIWTACGGSDTPEEAPPAASSSKAAPAAEAPAPAAAEEPEFANTEWKLVALDGNAISAAPNAVPTLQFSSAEGVTGELPMIGFSGCNNFFGNYIAGDDGSLSMLAPSGMTRKACPEPLQSIEADLMQLLEAATGYSIEDGELTIRSENGSLRFSGG